LVSVYCDVFNFVKAVLNQLIIPVKEFVPLLTDEGLRVNLQQLGFTVETPNFSPVKYLPMAKTGLPGNWKLWRPRLCIDDADNDDDDIEL